jgi:energy-coupling factor transporter ATP-binding protein EcfA2
MSDPRLDALRPVAEVAGLRQRRIASIAIQGYRFFQQRIELKPEAKNLLVYGENGTGKSTLFRALALLAGRGLGRIAQERNIFGGPDTEIEFGFSDGTSFVLDADSEGFPDAFAFLRPPSVFVPLLDYKRLLRVHFSAEGTDDHINIYAMVRELFKDYPQIGGGKLSDIRSFPDYFRILDKLLNEELLGSINELIGYFDREFTIAAFEFSTELDVAGVPNPQVRINIEYHGTAIDRYHQFLNEARLSALAIAMYFASILRLMGTVSEESCKILVLDDLLISLDMSNRLHLLDILRDRFPDFQIFFFTHDRELFEIYRGKLEWVDYEFYLDDTGPVPAALIKRGKTELERAKAFFASKDYDACALLLRKGLERLLKVFLPLVEQHNKNYEELDLAGLIGKAKARATGDARTILERLDTDRTHILNPLCHMDNRSIYSPELKSAMDELGRLLILLGTGQANS